MAPITSTDKGHNDIKYQKERWDCGLPAVQTKRKVKTPQFDHSKSLCMPHMCSQPLSPIPRHRETTLRILPELVFTPYAARKLIYSFEFKIVTLWMFLPLPSPIWSFAVMGSGPPPFVPLTTEIVVQSIGYNRVKALKFRGSRLSKLLHIYRSRGQLSVASIRHHNYC